MSITLEELRGDYAKLGDKIVAFERQLAPTKRLIIAAVEIDLYDGEEYAGYLFGEKKGQIGYHVILLPGELDKTDWNESIRWAREASGTQPNLTQWRGDLPSPREQSLLHANVPDEFQPAAYWSNKVSDNDSGWARCQYFLNGNQNTTHKGARLRARRVRRFIPPRAEA